MQLERVEFVLRHQIEIILDLFFVEEVAGDVQQQAAPAKSRPVFDTYGRYRPRHRPLRLGWAEDLRRQKLKQGLRAVEQARPVDGGNRHAVGRHVQRVALGAEGGVCILGGQHDRVVSRCLAVRGRHRQVEARAAPDSFGQLFSDAGRVRRILVDKDGGVVFQNELARFPLHPQRLRQQGQRFVGLDRPAAQKTAHHHQQDRVCVSHGRPFRQFDGSRGVASKTRISNGRSPMRRSASAAMVHVGSEASAFQGLFSVYCRGAPGGSSKALANVSVRILGCLLGLRMQRIPLRGDQDA